MGRELQKRKRRSSRPAVKQLSSKRSGKRLTHPLGNSLVASRWDRDLTATQNFRRLGLVGRLNAPTGGLEPDRAAHRARRAADADPFAISGKAAGQGAVSEARVERDPETGRILRFLDNAAGARDNPLGDPLRQFDSDSEGEEEEKKNENGDGEEWGGIDEEEGDDDDDSDKKKKNPTGIVKQLQAEADRPLVKKVRGLSQREAEWLGRLAARHGDDTAAMARDPRLNPMQQTAADIGKRLAKLRAGGVE